MTIPFSINAAIASAHLAKAAYSDLPIFWGQGSQMVSAKPTTEVDCLVVHESNAVVFSFRGTADMAGWMVDAHIAFHSYTLPNGQVIGIHAGFFGTVDAVFARLSTIAIQAVKDGKKVCMTGHSKGAAECVILALRLAYELGIKVEPIYNFGMPRVFDKAGQKAFEAIGLTLWRVISMEDIVARIPSFFNYRHVGQVAFFDSEGDLLENPNPYFRMASDFFGMVVGFITRKLVFTYDHSINLYLSEMAAWQDKYQPNA